MPTVHGGKARLWMDDQNAVSQDMRADLNSITFSRSKNNPEATTFNDGTIQRLDGLKDATLDFSGVYRTSTGASAIAGLLDTMWSNSLVSRIQYFPAGSNSGCPVYTACMVLNSYGINSPVDGIVSVTFSMAMAAGSVTAACVA